MFVSLTDLMSQNGREGNHTCEAVLTLPDCSLFTTVQVHALPCQPHHYIVTGPYHRYSTYIYEYCTSQHECDLLV